jgi:colanic acid/amylovoran biosynthesis glycosyltransferase
MHIAYLINQYPKVSHTFIRREILALEAIGFQVDRYALRGWNDNLLNESDLQERKQTHYLLRQGLIYLLYPVLTIALKRPLLFCKAILLSLQMSRKSPRSWPYHLVYFAEACYLLKKLRSKPCDHIHAHFGTNSAEVAMLANALGGPTYSLTIHGPEEFDHPEALHLTEKIHCAEFVAAICSYNRSQLYRRLPYVEWQKIKIVRCGLNQTFLKIPPETRPKEDHFVCVGRLCEQKGQLLLVQTLKRLNDKGIFATLTLVGDGVLRPQIEELLRYYDLEKQVRITGWVSETQVRDEILAARALVLPSFAEGLPMVIMEAMALRRPVLSTYVAGIPELVENKITGWLFPAGDESALADAMEICLKTSTKHLEKMGEAARKAVLQNHDINIETAKLAAYFKEIEKTNKGGIL